jgi:ATP-dependent exoDNAse (exonuclease V) beta subunit
MAARAAGQFQAMKEERGALDFVDLEGRTLELLARSDVARVIADEFDLLFVDEFQDTSPLQLALFLRIASLVRVQTAWVGDIKQAIYGFRGSDPELMNAAVRRVRARGGVTAPLGTSYRARGELNEFFNAIFAPAFQETHGFPPDEVCLEAERGSKPELSLAMEAWTLSSGKSNRDGSPKAITNAQAASAIAEGVARLMSSGITVEDRDTKSPRPLRQGDIAILCRVNDRAEEVASALVGRGFSVTRETSGLLGTPEVVLALACLRRLLDPTDTVASAEIVALEGTRSPEEWIEDRLEWVSRETDAARTWGTEGTLVSAALVSVERLRPRALLLTPSEALDETLTASNAFGVATAWGPTRGRAAQRRSNLEALRGLARAYEDAGQATDQPPTTAGFILWCQRLAADGTDHLAIDKRADAIKVMTWHGAKGLEWPVVICNNLEEEPRPRIWDESIVIQDGDLDANAPLANRRLQFWPWPFGQQKNNIPLDDRAGASQFGQWAAEVARREELRLLYVGLTRARDILIFATREGKAPASLLGVPALRLPEPLATGEDLAEAGGVTWRRRRIAAPEAMPAFEPEGSFPWFAPPVARTVRPAAHLTPSAAPTLVGAGIGRILRLGGRLPISGLRDDQEGVFGDALHALLAFAMLHPEDGGVEEVARRIFARHGVGPVADPAEAAAMAARFREGMVATFGPTAVAIEEPFQSMHPGGGIVAGTIDLLLHTARGLVIIDHKAFPGNEADQAIRALSHSGQLALYREALESAGHPVFSTWIHFAVGGNLIEVATLASASG